MKKLLTATLSLVCAFTCAAGLTACGGGDEGNGETPDKTLANKEFTEYREKVITVLKDNGIHVNDIDEKNSAKRARHADNSDKIGEIVMGGNPTEAYETVKGDRDSIFEQSFYISLILGDVISNYHDETTFYNIPVYFEEFNQYFEVVRNGGNDLVRCFTPEQGDMSSSVLTMELDFESAENYSFTCMQIWDNMTIFAYGNSNGNYHRVWVDDMPEQESGTSVYYLSGNDGYYTTDAEATRKCYELIKEQVDAVDKQPIESLKDRYKYRITKEQSEETSKKYFSYDLAPNVTGIQYDEYNGKKIAISYFAYDEETVTIPSEVEYIVDNFVIEDMTGTVKSLHIPSSIKGVYSQSDAGYTAVSANDLKMDLINRNTNDFALLNSITVEKGSPLFNAGTGSLYTTGGKLLYLADYPLETLDLSILEYIEFGNYTRLFDKITSVDLNLEEAGQDAIFRLQEYVFPKMKALKEINLSGVNGDPANNLQLEFTVNTNLTVNCDFDMPWQQYGVVYPLLRFNKGKGGEVTVNLNGTSRADVYGAGVSVTVNIATPEIKFDIDGIQKPACDGGAVAVYGGGSLSEDQKTAFSFEYSEVSEGKTVMAAVLRDTGDALKSVAVPENVGEDITALYVTALTIPEIILNSKIEYVIWGAPPSNDTITLIYGGTMEEFERNVSIVNADFSNFFVKDCNDSVKRFHGSQISIVNIDIDGVSHEYVSFDGTVTILNTTDRDTAYFLVDRDGNPANLFFYNNDEIMELRLQSQSGDYKLYTHKAIGEEGEVTGNTNETFTVSDERCELTVSVTFVRSDPNFGGIMEITDMQGTINGNTVIWQDNEGAVFNEFGVSVDGDDEPYIVLFGFNGSQLVVKTCRQANLLENVEIRIGNEIVKRDFKRNEKYYFTDEQLPDGGREYYFLDKGGFYVSFPNQLDKDENGFYITVQSLQYEIVKLSAGEKSYTLKGENFNLNLTLNFWRDEFELDDRLFDPNTSEEVIEELLMNLNDWVRAMYQDHYLNGNLTREEFEDYIFLPLTPRIVSLTGTIDGHEIDPEYFADRNLTFGNEPFWMNNGDGYIEFTGYADGFDLVIEVVEALFTPYN